MALTALQIKHAKEGMHADGNGLYLRVQASGAKSWIFRFQLNLKRREMGIGTLADKSAIQARSEVATLSTLVRSGIDPIERRTLDAEQATLAALKSSTEATSFRTVAGEYIENHKPGWKNGKHAQQWTNTLTTYAYPTIGDKPVGQVTIEDVLAILEALWKTKTETATRLRSRMELASYAKAKKLREGENPALGAATWTRSCRSRPSLRRFGTTPPCPTTRWLRL